MTQKNEQHHDDNIWISLSDLWMLIKRSKKKMILYALLGAILIATYGLTKPMVYISNASFREKSSSPSVTHTSTSIAAVLLGSSRGGSFSEAISTFKSRTLLAKLVKQMNLQGTLSKHGAYFPIMGNVRDNLKTEFSLLMDVKGPFFPDNELPIALQNLNYDGEIPRGIKITFLTEDTFALSTSRKANPVPGKLGEPVEINTVSFTLVRQNDEPLSMQEFNLIVQPLSAAILILGNKIEAEVDRDDKTLVRLKCVDTNRFRATKILNATMAAYQHYLREEQMRISQAQIAYLESRQDEMKVSLHQLMQEHATVLAFDVVNLGFPDIKSAMAFFANAQQKCNQDLLAIDLELKALKQIQRAGIIYKPVNGSQEQAAVENLVNKIRDLRQQYDSLEVSMGDVLKKFPRQNIPGEFQGIDLNTAKGLYLGYSKELDSIEAAESQQKYIINQIAEPTFDISSLSSILTDGVSQKMIAEASAHVFALKDQNNRTTKELERLRQELVVQKGFLTEHLNQSIELLKLRHNLILEKIQNLKILTLDLIEQEVSVLDKHLFDLVKTRLEQLDQERSVIVQHQKDLQEKMAKLPVQWVSERIVDQQMNLNANMVEEITKLVESKNTSHNLDLIQSAPVDAANIPVQPKNPRTLFLAVLGAILGVVFALGHAFARTLIDGFPVSLSNLQLARQHIAGKLSERFQTAPESTLADNDLATLRRLTVFLEQQPSQLGQGRTASFLLGPKGMNYSSRVAQLLSKQGRKIVIISLKFDQFKQTQEQDGIIQYLEGIINWPNIHKKAEYDFINSGGVTRFGHELLCSSRFPILIEELRKKYDWVILVSRAPIGSPEAEHLISIAQNSVISIAGETWKDIQRPLHIATAFNPPKVISFIC